MAKESVQPQQPDIGVQQPFAQFEDEHSGRLRNVTHRWDMSRDIYQSDPPHIYSFFLRNFYALRGSSD